jgi:hypothetical protein
MSTLVNDISYKIKYDNQGLFLLNIFKIII